MGIMQQETMQQMIWRKQNQVLGWLVTRQNRETFSAKDNFSKEKLLKKESAGNQWVVGSKGEETPPKDRTKRHKKDS